MINQTLLLAGDDAYNLTKSLRFRSSASAYLSRTFGSATSTTTGTFSFWMKRGKLSNNYQYLWSSSNVDLAYFDSSDNLWIAYLSNLGYVNTNAVFRDPSAWYHIMIVFDTTNATAANRLQVYVNGVAQSLNWGSTPQTQNATFQRWNVSGYTGDIGDFQFNHTNNFDGYFAEYYWIDGQALTPSSFGETDVLTGVWKPKKYAGTYGTNGFYLPFTDVATTSGSNAGLGKDFSGNGNYWTTNNISVTAGTTYDSMSDVPTLTSATTANYAVFNPLWRLGGSGYITPTNGNLRASIGGTNNIIASTIPLPTTGKWYMEFTLTTAVYPEFGLCNNSANGGGGASNIFGMYMSLWFANGSNGSHDGNVPDTSGDIGLIAVDVDNNKLWIGRNRSGTVVWMGGGNPSSGTSPSFSASGGGGVYATTFNAQTFNNPFVASGAGSDVWDANFGQQPWVGTPPTGFVALNTFNLPEPSIKQGNKHFDATTYTGNGTGQSIVNSGGMQPDLVWLKSRSAAYNHGLIDSVRGINKHLFSNLTNAEATCSTGKGITALNSNGFTLGTESDTSAPTNENGTTFVGWQWKAGNSAGSSNTAGSITSTVSANPTAGFSVVTYTGSGSNGTVGHGLGVAPKMIFVKDRTQGGTYRDWAVYNADIGAGNSMYLNSTSGSFSKPSYWNSTTATSSVFSLGSDITVNQSGDAYVAYCFAEVAGYSKALSWTGNGSTDGVFVNCGFSPAFIIMKRTDSTSDWVIIDNKRLGYNVTDVALNPNASYAENSGYATDFLSNGFKLRTTTGYMNASGGTYIGFAFAQNPFKNSLAR